MYDRILGLYKAIVSEVNEIEESGKKFARIKVYCPEIYGYNFDKEESIESPWVYPAFSYPLDYFSLRKGDVVWIAFMNGDISKPVYIGFPIEEEDKDNNLESLNPNVEDYQNERIIGFRDGSYIKFNDKDDSNYFEIGFLGKTLKFPSRIASKLRFEKVSDGSIIFKVSLNDESGSNLTEIFVKVSSNENYIKIIDNQGNIIVIDENGINITGKNNNSVVFDENGVEISDKNSNLINMSNNGIVLEDRNGNKIEMGSTSVKVNDTALEVLQ